MFKKFLTRKLIEAKMKDVPAEQREQILTLVEKNPELFKKIGKEIEDRKKLGQDEMAASMAVMKKYQGQLRNMLGK